MRDSELTGTEVTTVDVVVVGSGAGGLSAAIVARDLGAEVLVLEKSAQVGGTLAISAGNIWAPANPWAKAAGIDDSQEEALAHVRELSGNRHSEPLLQTFMGRINEALTYLQERAEVPFYVIPKFPDYYAERKGGKADGRYIAVPTFYPTEHLPAEWQNRLVTSPYFGQLPVSWKEIQSWGGFGTISTWNWEELAERVMKDCRGFGSSVAGYMLKACLQRKVTFWTESGAERLLTDEAGRVTGVEVVREGSTCIVHARRGVIIASGGYDANRTLQAQWDPHPEAQVLGRSTVDGSGVLMALELGASFQVIDGQLLVPVYAIPGEEMDGRPMRRLFVREPGFPGSLVVNRGGKRFSDESFYRAICGGMANFDVVSQSYPNLPAYFIFDEQWKQRYPLGPIMAGEKPKWLASAATITELAERLRIDGAGLEASLARYNEAAAKGEDPEFGRGTTSYGRHNGDPAMQPNPCLRPLAGPFYGVQIELGSSGTNSGLLIDTVGRVRHVRGFPIPGLYAAGNTAANLVEGLFYNSGIANARGLLFGYLAARHACEAEAE